MTTVTNGVNFHALLDARDALKGAPEAAQFTWRGFGVLFELRVFLLGQNKSITDKAVWRRA
jgi:hypothetical protein